MIDGYIEYLIAIGFNLMVKYDKPFDGEIIGYWSAWFLCAVCSLFIVLVMFISSRPEKELNIQAIFYRFELLVEDTKQDNRYG